MPELDIGIVPSAAGPRGLSRNGGITTHWIDPSGALVVMDFFAKAILDDRGYQVRAGTITTPLTGDVLITDTAAEMSADVASGLLIIPVFLQVDIEALGGTLPQVTAKSVDTVSSSGTAFVPLPLNSGGPAASSTARVAGAGGVTVTAELATTTLRHYARTIAVAGDVQAQWEPLRPPVLNGARCFYVQVGSVTTGSTYFAHFDYLEFTAAQMGQ